MAFENLKSTGIKYVLTKLKDYFLMIKDAVKSVNGNEPDENGDITITSVPYASNLESESSHRSYDVFLQRTTGGDSSVSNGDAWLMNIKGNNVHDGYVAEDIEMTVTALGEDPITATLDRDTFVSYVSTSGTTTLVYSTDWSADPTLYGITVTGTPVAGDTIVVEYTKEVRGTITVANPQSFVSTGWNLYDHSNGYAKVVKYAHGYRIDGTYTAIKFATTPTGTQNDVVVNSGNFDIPSDGYIIVIGGNSSSTAIYPVWEDWDEGYTGDFEAYNASIVDLSTIMSTYFPYGLLKAGSVVDELNLNLGQAISRVERMNYTAENLATAKASGREYEYDENYIYLARTSAVTTSVTVSGSVTVNDHGIEYFSGSSVEVDTEILYGNNLKNKLERDVLTISSQLLNAAQQAQVRANIGAAGEDVAYTIDKNLLNVTTVNDTSLVGKTTYLASSVSGLPTSDNTYYTIIMLGSAQFAFPYFSAKPSDRMFFRICVNGTWKAWKEIGRAKGNADTYAITLGTGVSADQADVFVTNNVGFVNVRGLKRSSAGTGWVTIGTISSGVKAAIRTNGIISDDSNMVDGTTKVAQARVNTDGTIDIYSPQANMKYYGSFSFPLG